MSLYAAGVVSNGKPVRKIILDPGDRPPPQGPSRIEARNTVNVGNSQQQSSIEMHYGVVQYGIEQAGWQRVALGNGRGVVATSGGGRSEVWGVYADQSYAVGTSVIVAVDTRTGIATILGQSPLVSGNDPGITSPPIAFAAQVGSWTTSAQDPLAKAYLSVTNAGGAYALARGPLADKHAQDWSVVGAMGSQITIGTLEAQLAVDDVTGVWLNLLDQAAEVSGRGITVAGDGVNLANDREAKVGRLQLSGSLAYFNDPELQQQSIQDAGKTSSEYIYHFGAEADPVEQYQLNTYAMVTGAISHDRGQRVTTGEDQSVDFSLGSQVVIPQLRFIEHTPGDEDSPEQWFPAPAEKSESQLTDEDIVKDKTARLKLKQRLTGWGNLLDRSHFNYPLYAFTSQAAQWCESVNQYIQVDTKPDVLGIVDADAPADETSADYAQSESIQFGDADKLDSHFVGSVQDKPAVGGWIIKQEDGSIYIGTGLGAGIRLIGDSVFIEGGNIRLCSPKDISLIARDINVAANRDVNVTCKNFLRIASQRNIGIAGGLSGTGGVLIESRSTQNVGDLPDDPRLAMYTGVTLSALRTHVSMNGGHVFATASAGSVGKLYLRNKNGLSLISSNEQTVLHGSTLMHAFGDDPLQPESSSTFTRYAAILDTAIFAKDAWFSGAVSAGSHIQSYYGVMADSRGAHVGKVRYPEKFTTEIERQSSFNAENLSKVTGKLEESLKPLQDGDGGPLNKQFQQDLSLGYVADQDAVAHYGSKHLQPTYPAMFQPEIGYPTQSRAVFRVTYRPGSGRSKETYPWPGNTQSIQMQIPADSKPAVEKIKQMLTSDPQYPKIRYISFAEAFQTLADKQIGSNDDSPG